MRIRINVFLLVMAFLTSATSLAAALVQYQAAKIAAQAAKIAASGSARIAAGAASGSARIAASAAEDARIAASAAEGVQRHHWASRRQKTAYRRFRREKKRFFSPQ